MGIGHEADQRAAGRGIEVQFVRVEGGHREHIGMGLPLGRAGAQEARVTGIGTATGRPGRRSRLGGNTGGQRGHVGRNVEHHPVPKPEPVGASGS